MKLSYLEEVTSARLLGMDPPNCLPSPFLAANIEFSIALIAIGVGSPSTFVIVDGRLGRDMSNEVYGILGNGSGNPLGSYPPTALSSASLSVNGASGVYSGIRKDCFWLVVFV